MDETFNVPCKVRFSEDGFGLYPRYADLVLSCVGSSMVAPSQAKFYFA